MSVNGVTSSTYLNYAKRIGRVVLHSTFGTGMDEFITSMDKSLFAARPANRHWYSNPWAGMDRTNLGTKFKDAFKAVEAHEEALRKANGGSYLKTFWNQIRTIPEVFTKECKDGYNTAKAAGKSAIGGGFKGFNKALMKRMPLIGGLMAVGFQIPNLITAFTHEKGGVGTGLVETGKAAMKLGLDTAGFMVGQALIPIPFVGGLIGSFAASWLGETIFGKSFAEKHGEQSLPGELPFIAQNQTSGATGGGYSGWTPPKPTMSEEQIIRTAQQLNRGVYST